MANGRQIGDQNFQRFVRWHTSLCDADFKLLERKGGLNRTKIAEACSFGRSVFGQNPRIHAALVALEDDLILRGILGRRVRDDSTSNAAETGPSRRVAKVGGDSQSDFETVLSLESTALLEQIASLRSRLARLTLVEEILEMTGRMPR